MAQRAMQPSLIVFFLPALHNDPGLQERVKDLSIQKLIPKLPDERLHITVLLFEFLEPPGQETRCQRRFDLRHSRLFMDGRAGAAVRALGHLEQ